jgi:hypothetical protein
LSIAYGWLSRNAVPLWNQNVPVVAAVYQNGGLLWPAVREVLESGSTLPNVTPPPSPGIKKRSISSESLSAVEMNVVEVQQRAVLKDIDFWMF